MHAGSSTLLLLLLGLLTGLIKAEAFSTSVDRLAASLSRPSPPPPPQNSIVFPIKPFPTPVIAGGKDKSTSATDPNIAIGDSLSSAFENWVSSSDFLEPNPSDSDPSPGHRVSSCRIPVFGDLATLTFSPRPSLDKKDPTEYVLSAYHFDRPLPDFGNLCLMLYRHRDAVTNVVGIHGLERNVLDYLNSRPPDRGVDAELTSCAAIGNERFGSLLDDLVDGEVLGRLERDGYVVIDDIMGTSPSSNERVGAWREKSRTDQGHIRTDTVAFLDRENAMECGLEEQYDFLLTLASHLNDNLDLYASPYEPVSPGSRERPLTNPSRTNVQIAEYGCGDYYDAHSDNSIDTGSRTNGVFEGIRTATAGSADASSLSRGTPPPRRRSNLRCITAILYLNRGWKVSDGGQLRMYLDSSSVERPVTASDTHSYVDINPSNGKLLLFDSRMIHSVERVVSQGKTRRALTLWITRPEESGVRGEDYFLSDV